MSFAILIYLIKWKPIKTKFANYIEIFNEISILMISYLALGFTNAEPDAEKRSMLGRCFIGLSLGNIAFHLVILLFDSIKKVINLVQRLKKRY